MNYLLLSLLAILPTALFAQEEYVPLEPIPGLNINVGSSGEGGLATYLNDVFVYGVGLAAVLAVLYIVWGGFKWMSTDSVTGKSEGKTIISQALLGLALVLSTYLILYTIGGENAVRLNIGSESLRLNSSVPTEQPGNQNGVPAARDCSTFPPPDSRKFVAYSPSGIMPGSPSEWWLGCCNDTGGTVDTGRSGATMLYRCIYPGYQRCGLFSCEEFTGE